MLLRTTGSTAQPNQIRLVELDITTQTVVSSVLCLVFEGVAAHDTNYSLVYSSGFLVLVYPTYMLAIYQDNGYFAKRSEDPECRGLDFFDYNLAGASDDSTHLALKHVVQSQVKILAPILHDTNLVFLSTRQSPIAGAQSDKDGGHGANSASDPTFLIHLPLSEVDMLGQKHQVFTMADNRFGREKGIYLRKSPLLDLASEVTDLVQVAKAAYAVTFTCGTVWITNVVDSAHGLVLLGLAYLTEFLGQETKASCVNTIDHVLIPWKQQQSMHPSLFNEAMEDGPRVTEFLMFGDASGNLVLYKNRQPVFHDQITYGQVAAVKFLNVSLVFAVISSDGVLKICRFRQLAQRQGDSNNTYEIEKLASVQSFEELNSQLKLRRIHMRGSVAMQTHAQSSVLESTFGTIQVLWPTRILMKVKNKRHNEDKFFAECELQIHRVFPSFHPMIKRDYTPIVFSNVLPMQFKDFVPQPDPETGSVQMHCERHCFFIDKIMNQNSAGFKFWLSAYDYATDTRTPLVNISEESGVQDTDHFSVVRLDMRPAGLNPLGSQTTAKILCTLELSNGQAGVSGMCCSFAVDMQTGSLTENNLLLSGKTGIYLGKLDYKDPSILVLQEEMRSLIIFSFDEGDLESKLPHGEIRLSSQVTGVYWTPMRDGLAVLYELAQENLLTFSKNRLDRYSVKDFGILASRNVGLKLHYDERIFDVKWTGFTLGFAADDRQTVKGVVGTNQHIYFVDDKLGVLGVIKWHQQAITSIQWMGDQTVLVTTRNHLMQVYSERNPKTGIIISLTDSQEQSQNNVIEATDLPETPIVVKALADRVIFASQKLGGPAKFLSRPILMLEPILLGYLSSMPVGKVDVSNVQNCLKYLDTVSISQKLLEVLTKHSMAKSVKFLLKNQPMLTNKVGLQPHQILQIEDFSDLLQALFPQKDLVNSDQDKVLVRKKLALDPACSFQKKLLQKRAEMCIQRYQLLDAFSCADLLQDLDMQVKVLQKSIDIGLNQEGVIRQFLTAASATDQFQSIRFDFGVDSSGCQLTNRQRIDKVSKRVPERQIQKLMLAFDEVPLSYACPEGAADGDLSLQKPMAPVAFNSENFSTYIGITKYVDPGMRNVGGANNIDGDGADSDGDSANGGDSFDNQTDDVDERRHLKAYWRAEEGQGHQVADLSDKGIHLIAEEGQLAWHSQVNADRDPLDYEDKWGKLNPANYAFYAPASGLKIVKKEGQALSQKSGHMTFEFWLKESGEPNEMLILVLLQEENCANLCLTREEGRLKCQFYPQQQNQDTQITKNIPDNVNLSNWTHFAVLQNNEGITLIINFESVVDIPGQLFGTKTPQSQFKVLQAISAEQISVTELRLWQVALAPKQVKNMARQPLSLLFEQKQNLNIQIKKSKAKSKQEESNAEPAQVDNQFAEEQKQVEQKVAPKKKGGLKFTSKLDAKKVPQKPTQVKEDAIVAKPQIQKSPVIKEEENKQEEVINFAFDGFDMGPQASAAPNEMFSFGGGFEENQQPLVNVPEQSPASQPTDFFSFEDFSSAPVAAPPPTSNDAFNFNSSNPIIQMELSPAKDEEDNQELKQNQPVAAAFDMFNFDSMGGGNDPENLPQPPDEEEKKMMSPIMSTKTQPQFQASLAQLNTAEEESKAPRLESQSVESPTKVGLRGLLSNKNQQRTIEEPSKEVEVVEDLSFDEMMTKVEQFIAQAQLSEAAKMIQRALEKCRVEAKTVQSSDQKLVVKNRIRKSVVMKFTCDLAQRISEVKARISTSESPFQTANLKSQIASMANVLILLKLPDAMRTNFFRFALKQNSAIENYSSLSKIVSFWKKYSTESPQAALTDKDRQKIEEIEAQCRSRQNRNVQQYHGDDCPQCGANLAFGLATPQCHKCKAKIAICYKLLKPILKDKQTLKCHVCLAHFSIYSIQQVNNLCPYCQLVKLKLNVP